MRPTAKLAVAVLAGGEGSRIGGGKPLIDLGGKALVERAIDLARNWSTHAVVVIRSPDQLGSHQLPWITDAAGIEGPLAGLAGALEWAGRLGTDALVTIPCDMPFLPPDLAERLMVEAGEYEAALASSGGELHPVCGLWRNAAIDELPSYGASGRRSLRGFAEQLGFAKVDWPAEPSDPFFNVNSLADLATAEARLRA